MYNTKTTHSYGKHEDIGSVQAEGMTGTIDAPVNRIEDLIVNTMENQTDIKDRYPSCRGIMITEHALGICF